MSSLAGRQEEKMRYSSPIAQRLHTLEYISFHLVALALDLPLSTTSACSKGPGLLSCANNETFGSTSAIISKNNSRCKERFLHTRSRALCIQCASIRRMAPPALFSHRRRRVLFFWHSRVPCCANVSTAKSRFFHVPLYFLWQSSNQSAFC